MNPPGPTKMSLIHLHFKQRESDAMPRVSLRTLILMLELLVAVVAWQSLTMAKPARADALWVAADCHTASSIQRRVTAPAATASRPVTTDEGTREP
jgi:hypothetical protein